MQQIEIKYPYLIFKAMKKNVTQVIKVEEAGYYGSTNLGLIAKFNNLFHIEDKDGKIQDKTCKTMKEARDKYKKEYLK